MKKLVFSILMCLMFNNIIKSQIQDPVKWQFDYLIIDSKSIELKFTANIEKNWSMYGTNIPEGGPISTSFHFDTATSFNILGPIKEITQPVRKIDTYFDNMEIPLHKGKAIFTQKVSLNKTDEVTINGYIEYMACNDKMCLPPKEKEFKFKISGVKNLKQSEKNEIVSSKTSEESQRFVIIKNMETISKQDSLIVKSSGSDKAQEEPVLWRFLLIAFLTGLAATMTPCVYPMIPMTVSFFLRNNISKIKAISKGLFFGLSIIIVYLLIGALGGNFIQLIATHWLSNLIFFLLFVIFAASFFGMFEIMLPGSIATKVDNKAEKGGYVGIFFMALALVIVSFSCTAPFVGFILIEGSKNNFGQSMMGMLSYSIAFALPYTFFAIFPALLKSLPKSGGWLNEVKVTLGLIMLAFSLKFLVNVDQSYHLNLISREIFISIWIAISIITGFYFLGKLRFVHDSGVDKINFSRLMLAVFAFSFSIYMATGFGDNQLSAFSSIMPPPLEQSEVASKFNNEEKQTQVLCSTPQYSDFLHLPYGIKAYFDYKEGLACAKAQGKPAFIVFKGHSCADCKIMEAKVFSDPEVQRVLMDNYVIIVLYNDDKTMLPEKNWIISKMDGRQKKTIGQLNVDLEITLFKTNTMPLYAIVDFNGNNIVNPIGMELNIQKFLAFLYGGIADFKNKI